MENTVTINLERFKELEEKEKQFNEKFTLVIEDVNYAGESSIKYINSRSEAIDKLVSIINNKTNEIYYADEKNKKKVKELNDEIDEKRSEILKLEQYSINLQEKLALADFKLQTNKKRKFLFF